MNVVILEQCIPIIQVFVATWNQLWKEPMEEIIIGKNSPTKGGRMKWDQEKAIPQELIGEIQGI